MDNSCIRDQGVGTRPAAARRIAAIMESDDIRLGIEIAQLERGRVGIPAIAAETQQQKALRTGLARRQMRADQPDAVTPRDFEPLGRWRQGRRWRHVTRREEYARLRKEKISEDRQIKQHRGGQQAERFHPHELRPPLATGARRSR